MRVFSAQSLLLILGMISLVGMGIAHVFPPFYHSNSESTTVFSAQRASAHIQQIASQPHPTGTPENDKVRHYLLTQLKALGLMGEVQSAFSLNPKKNRVGKIHNVLVKLQGTKPGKALLLVAHYDSVHTGPGAADNGASVAAILETLRILKSQPSLQNDVICLFTDGEELGLLGAKAFLQQHPWAKNIGMALNFEYRGNRGAFMMFETSQGNGKLIEGLANSVPYVLANSLMDEVYKRLPNDTDFSVFKQVGISGMNFAAIAGHTAYHTQLDNIERLDQDTLQQEGELMLALVNHFGDLPLDNLESSDRIYFDMPVVGVVHYPISWVLPFNVLIVLLFIGVLSTAIIMEQARVRSVGYAAIIFFAAAIVLTISSHYFWEGFCRWHPDYNTYFQGDTYNSHWYLIAFVLLNTGLFWLSQAFVCKWLKPFEYCLGSIICWLILLITVSSMSPGASFLFLWPLAGQLLALGIILFLQNHSWQWYSSVLLLLGMAPGLIIFTPLIINLFIGLTPQLIGVVVLFLVLLLGLITPPLEIIGKRRRLISLILVLGFAAIAMASLTSGFDEKHPRQSSLFYTFDANNQKAYWVSADNQLDQWTSTFFSNPKEKQPVAEVLGGIYPAMWLAPAPILSLPAPAALEIEEDRLLSDKAVKNRLLKLRVKSARLAPQLKIMSEGAPVLASKVGGQDYTRFSVPYWYLTSVGLNKEELLIEITIPADSPFALRLLQVEYGLPALGQLERPASTISKPGELNDTTIISKVFRF